MNKIALNKKDLQTKQKCSKVYTPSYLCFLFEHHWIFSPFVIVWVPQVWNNNNNKNTTCTMLIHVCKGNKIIFSTISKSITFRYLRGIYQITFTRTLIFFNTTFFLNKNKASELHGPIASRWKLPGFFIVESEILSNKCVAMVEQKHR